MIEELANLIDDFPGPANQTRCFLHILNLVVKSIIRQFDLPKSKKKSGNDGGDNGSDNGRGDDGDDGDDEFLTALDQETEELLKLGADIDLEEEITAGAGEETDTTEDDNEEGWVDEREEMTEEELSELERSVQPVRLLLTKVSKQLHNTLLSNSGGFLAAKDCLCN
jgi:hypothetical protein